MGTSFNHLSQEERDYIGMYKAQGWSFGDIAKELGRHRGTIRREYNKNKNEKGEYLASEAHERAMGRRRGSRGQSKCEPYKGEIHSLLALGDTPEQVAKGLSQKYIGFNVSHETIYQYIYRYQIDWADLLVRKHAPRWYKGMGRKHNKRPMIPNRVCYSTRPEHINNRTEIGHWEGDTIVCSQSKQTLLVMVERLSRYVIIRRVESRSPEPTKEMMIKALSHYKKCARKSITLDNGIEFKYHEQVKERLGLDTYFCQPYHSWEKGSVENMNGLIRRYIPKKTDISKVLDRELKLIEYLLNSRIRKTLNWKTPAQVFARETGMKISGGAIRI